MTPERRRDADTDGLAELFHAAVESRRSTPELMRVILAGALPLAGADLAIVCGPDGSLLSHAASEGVDEDAARALAREATEVDTRESHDDERYVARLTATAPYFFAMRWARGRSAHEEVARAVSGAVARLLLKTEEVPVHVHDGGDRPAHRSAVAHVDARAPRQRARGRAARRRARRRAVHRPRRFQGGQRHLRPRGRRSDADRGGAADEGKRAPQRFRRAASAVTSSSRS